MFLGDVGDVCHNVGADPQIRGLRYVEVVGIAVFRHLGSFSTSSPTTVGGQSPDQACLPDIQTSSTYPNRTSLSHVQRPTSRPSLGIALD